MQAAVRKVTTAPAPVQASPRASVGSLTALQRLGLGHNQLDSLPASISRLETNAQWEFIIIDQTQRVLLKALRPPLSTVRMKPFVQYCAWCHSESGEAGANLMKCTLCKRAWYCCKEHQTKHWKSSHKAACKAAQQVAAVGGGAGAGGGGNEKATKGRDRKAKKKRR